MPHRPTTIAWRRLRRAAVTAAAAGAALATVGATGVAGAHSVARAAGSAYTIHVIEHANTDFEAPGAAGKDVKGNILTFNNPVFAYPANKKQAGRDEGFCTRIQPKLGIWECLWTTFFQHGQITVQGPYYDTRNSVLSITGGTGAYEGARGQMNLVARDGGKEYDFIFHILG